MSSLIYWVFYSKSVVENLIILIILSESSLLKFHWKLIFALNSFICLWAKTFVLRMYICPASVKDIDGGGVGALCRREVIVNKWLISTNVNFDVAVMNKYSLKRSLLLFNGAKIITLIKSLLFISKWLKFTLSEKISYSFLTLME